ncbi:putative prophage phiRv2 integrase [Andreesenia angusta]|uniref:Putative prophage phiRv2 integrase n=1 Tax=Andreesenia angusta TaxID=39480 RepID=A0A1S1V3Y4_9FIRM|nr:site-specific integrase [Andreesenia angusta]OHW61416.1 putative prophage phiRv2 integrase [Andreesenia angusta]
MSGSIEKRGPNTYRLIVSAGFGLNGKRKRHTRTVKCRNKTEAQKELAKFIVEIESGDVSKTTKFSFEAFADKWLSDYGSRNLAPKTMYNYQRYLDTKIVPYIGHIELSKLSPANLLDLYNYLQVDYKKDDGTPLSINSVVKYHRLISSMLNTAIDWQLIKSNPAEKVKPGKMVKPKRDFYNEEELSTLLDALSEAPLKYRVAILVTIATGLRLGELMGLKWDNVDFESCTVTVERASQYLPTKGTFEKDPKNETSRRTISVPQSIIQLVKEYRVSEVEKKLSCGSQWIDSDFMFTQWNGSPMHPDTPSKWFNKFLKENGLKKITFHQLRHTSATILINAGINIRALSARLGHSNTSTTLNIYSHALQSMDQIAADKIESIMFNDVDDLEEKNRVK